MSKTKNECVPELNSFFPNEARDIAQLKQVFKTYDDLIVFAARTMHSQSEMANEIERQKKLLNEYQLAINLFATKQEKLSAEAVTGLMEDLAKAENAGAKSILEGINRHRRRTSKHLVSQRIDQRLKPLWMQHCQDVLSAGIQINRLADLFEFNSCSIDFKKNIDERTLKRWAKEVGVFLKPGRPSKSQK